MSHVFISTHTARTGHSAISVLMRFTGGGNPRITALEQVFPAPAVPKKITLMFSDST